MKRVALLVCGIVFTAIGLIGIGEAIYNGLLMAPEPGIGETYRSVVGTWLLLALLLIPAYFLLRRGSKS